MSVVDTQFGKVGGLNCWEHIQPLLRYYEYSQGVEIHIAGWPAFWNPPKDKPVSLSGDRCLVVFVRLSYGLYCLSKPSLIWVSNNFFKVKILILQCTSCHTISPLRQNLVHANSWLLKERLSF